MDEKELKNRTKRFALDIIIEAGLMQRRLVQPLLDEAEELVAIMVASRKSLSRKSAI